MKEINHGAAGVAGYGKQYGLTLGIVKNNADPAQQGRLQIYVPAYDEIEYKVEDLPWAMYVSPFGGVTADFKVGPEGESLPGISAYGFWAVPKNSAHVLVGCLDGNPAVRFWVGCVYMPEHNRTLPAGIDGVTSEIDESGAYPQKDFPHAQKRLASAGLWKGSTHFRTRGGYERSVAHPSNKNKNKPTDNGYAPKPLEPAKADSQTISLTSPGRHMFVMSDVDEHCRIRLKTTNGSQIILDDTNERIYISTGEGRNYIELDEGNGKVYVYSDSKVSIRAKNDLNLYSDENINIVANKRVNIKSEDRSVNIVAKHDVTATSSHADVLIAASRDLKLKAFNGPQAGAVGAQTIKTGRPLDVIYRWAEKGGSGTSNIELDAGQKIQTVSGQGTLITARGSEGVNLKSSGSVNLQGTSLNLAFPSVSFQGGANLNLIDTGDMSKIIVVGSCGSAAAYSGHKTVTIETPTVGKAGAQVKPAHESWDRDEDSAFAPNTPRNSKYIG